MNELRWILLGVGAVIIALIYLWGMRGMIRERLRERRRRAAARAPENEPVLGEDPDLTQPPTGLHKPGDPFAHQRLVDVEISSVRRISGPAEKSTAQSAAPAETEAGPESAAAPTAEEPAAEPVTKPAAPAQPAVRPVRAAPVPPAPRAGSRSAVKPGKRRPEPEMTLLLTVIPHQGRMFAGQRIQAVARELDLRLGDNGLLNCYPDAEAEDQKRPVFSVGHLREPGTFDTESLKSLSTPGLLMFLRLPGPIEGVAAMELMVAMAGKLADKLGGTVCDDRRNKMTNQELVHIRNEVIELERRRRAWAPQHA